MDDISRPDMVVLIATCNQNELLRRTLSSVVDAMLPAGARVVVVENGGKNGAQKVVEDFETKLPCQYVYVERGNKSHALNEALKPLGRELVVFLDDDVRVGAGFFQEYRRQSLRHGPGVFFGGPMECEYEKEIPRWLLEFLPGSVKGWTLGTEVRRVDEAGFLGSNWAAFASDLKEAGGFDPNFGPGSLTQSTGQETEMQLRLLEMGVTGLFLPKPRVWHYVRADQAEPAWCFRRSFRNGVEQALLSRKIGGPELFGKPRWVLREMVQSALKIPFASFSSDPAEQFRPRVRLAFLRGYVSGLSFREKTGFLRRSGVARSPSE